MAKGYDETIGYPVYTQLPPVLVVRRARNPCKSLITAVICLAVISLGTYLLWPSQVHVQVRKTDLVSLSWEKSNTANGRLSLGINLKYQLELRVKNRNLFGVSYDRLVVTLGYKGDEFGQVVLEGGHISPLSSVDLDAVMDLKGVKVLHHAVNLLFDITNGKLLLETDTDFSGNVEFLFFKPHIQTKLNCETLVNPMTNVIFNQSCLFAG